MSNSYKEKYEVLKTFKEDIYQTVLIGSNKDNSDEVVVVNILHKEKVSKIISKSQFPNGLSNLLHLEDVEDDLVVVTEYKEGTPLGSYLKFFDTTVKHKINLAYEYLAKVVKYDTFHNSIKKILIDESQIILKDKELYFNELLFLDEDFSQPTEFSVVSSKLGEMIEKIVFSKEPIEDKDNDKISQKIFDFIDKLKNSHNGFTSIEGIYNYFRKIYIYDVFMEDEYRLDNSDTQHSKANNTVIPPGISNIDAIGYSEVLESDKGNQPDTTETDSTTLAEDTVFEDNPTQHENAIEESLNDENELTNNFNEVLIGNEEISNESSKSKNIKKNRYKKRKKPQNSLIPKIAIGVILLFLLLYGTLSVIPAFNSIESNPNPELIKSEAYFTYQKNGDYYHITNNSKIYGEDNAIQEVLWKIYKDDKLIHQVPNDKSLRIRFDKEGQYSIVLSIEDKYGNIDDYSETIVYTKLDIDELKSNIASEEKLDDLDISYSERNIKKDYQAFRSGSYSLKIGNENSSNFEKITIDNIDIENKPIISMWIASDLKESINISVKGYRNNTLKFTQGISFTPKELNTWEMVEISGTTKNIDKIELIFKNFTSPIWLDDIEVNSYK